MEMGMHLLPVEITTDILSRLPAYSVIQCKLVCKTWRSFIDDPAFVDLHARRSSISNQENHHNFGFFFCIVQPIMIQQQIITEIRYGLYNDDVHNDDNSEKIPCFKLSKPITCDPAAYPRSGVGITPLNSCNGLVIITKSKNGIAVCNPFTGEYLDIPRFTTAAETKFYRSTEFGFGYVPSTNEYKIVVAYHYFGYHEEDFPPGMVCVYTLGSGKWTEKEEISYDEFEGINEGLHLNGAVYWVNKYLKEIVSFDLETEEEVRIVPSPQLPPEMYYANVGLLGGCLYVMRKQHYEYGYSADVLVRNKEDPTWSWKFSITYEELCSDCRPLAILRSGKILWYSGHRKHVVYYDPETGSLEMDENLPQFKSWLYIINYEKSFVSLKALGEMNARIYDLYDLIVPYLVHWK